MFPGPWFNLFGQPINGYVVFYVAALFAALGGFLWMARRRGLPLRFAVDAWALCAVAAWLGGGLFYALIGYGDWLNGSQGLGERLLGGGRTSIGSVLGASLAVTLLVRWHRDARAQPALVLDVFPLGFALCDLFGRLGCFMVGCCAGRSAFGLPWALEFPMESACVYRGIPVHPAQLYHAGGEVLLVVALVGLASRAVFRGQLLWLWLAGYGALRFTVEFFRGDTRPMLGALTLNQWICLGFVAVGAAMLVRHFLKERLALAGVVACPKAEVHA